MTEKAAQTDNDLQDIVADADTGGRAPKDKFGQYALWYIPLVWAIYQLWIASPLPFVLGVGVWNDTQTRAIHLGFAVLLAFIAFPAFKGSPRHKIPALTWAVAIVAAVTASYLWWDYRGVAQRTGSPNMTDVVMAGIGIVLLLEAARRSLGIPLMGVALFFLSYVFFGSWSGLPEVIQWKGASFEKAMSHMWLTTEGVFGVALGVSSGFVFLFVLFGALLNQAGAGNYFLQLAFSALGHDRPVLVLGDAIYRHEEIVTTGNDQSDFDAFMESRQSRSRSDVQAFLAAVRSEALIPGDFYRSEGRSVAVRGIIGKVVEQNGPLAAMAHD